MHHPQPIPVFQGTRVKSERSEDRNARVLEHRSRLRSGHVLTSLAVGGEMQRGLVGRYRCQLFKERTFSVICCDLTPKKRDQLHSYDGTKAEVARGP